MDLLLDRRGFVHDLVFVNGACPTTGDMIDRVTQRLYIKLRTFFDEWFLDETYGVPWLEQVLGQKTPKSRVDMIIQEQILEEDEVSQITEFNSSLTADTRRYSCTFRVRVAGAGVSEEITI